MKKVLTSAALVWLGAAVLWAQSGTTARPQTTKPQAAAQTQAPPPAGTGAAQAAPAKPAAAAPARQSGPSPADAVKYQAWVKQY